MEIWLPFAPADKTLVDAQAELREKMRRGTNCPCCNQYTRVYRRKFNSGMARSLIWLAAHAKPTNGGWVNVPETAPRHVVTSREFDKIALWDLVEQKPNDDDPTKRTTGLWRCKLAGYEFAGNKTTIESHVVIYNGDVLGFTGKPIDIKDALGKRFRYDELMNEAA